MILKRLPRGAGWMMYSYLAGFALQGAYFILLARALGADDYGLFVGALSLVTIFASVSGLGAGNVMVLRTSRDPLQYRTQLGTAYAYIAMTFVPLAIAAIFFAQWLAPDVAPALIPLLLSELVFTRAYDVGLQSFQAHEQLKGVAHLNVGAATLRVLLVGVFLLVGAQGALAWSWFYAGSTILIAVSVLIVCAIRFGTPRLDRGSLSTTWRLGSFFALGMSSRILVNDSDKFILAGSGRAAEAGQYGAAHRLVSMAFAPLQAITYSLNTQLFRAGVDGYGAVWRVLARVMPLAVGYVLFAMGALWALAPVAAAILGPGYELVGVMLPLLGLMLIGQTGTYFFGDALMGLGKQSVRSICQAIVGVLVLVLNVVFTPVYGWSAAAAIAIGASLLLAGLLFTIFMWGLRSERRKGAQG